MCTLCNIIGCAEAASRPACQSWPSTFQLLAGYKMSTQRAAEVSSAAPQSNYGLDWGFGAGHQVVTPSAPDREPVSVSHSQIVLVILRLLIM